MSDLGGSIGLIKNLNRLSQFSNKTHLSFGTNTSLDFPLAKALHSSKIECIAKTFSRAAGLTARSWATMSSTWELLSMECEKMNLSVVDCRLLLVVLLKRDVPLISWGFCASLIRLPAKEPLRHNCGCQIIRPRWHPAFGNPPVTDHLVSLSVHITCTIIALYSSPSSIPST